MQRVASLFAGQGMMARVLRSASWLMIGYGGSQALRLASNLILTRILFPEAFGLMALVTVVTVGLSLFSDVGIGPSIAQNKRGDDPAFLDTAWTIQVIRGFGLWALTALLAWPAAVFYGTPELLIYLPIAGAGLAVAGFNPTRIETAHRHLLAGRVTVLELAGQVIGLAAMVGLALATQSVIALVLGGVIQAAAKLALCHYGLPGAANRFRWEKAAARELIHFGKWIFLSTAFWFLTSQGDRAILGKFVSLEVLGVYNIGYFLASFPMLLGHAVNQRLMIPVYRDKPAQAAPENLRRQRQLRGGLTGGILGLLLVMAWAGPWLVQLLYDDRYMQAGPMMVLIALALAPAVITMTYDQAALAAGDSRGFFVFSAARACLQTVMFLGGVAWFGLAGGITALGLAMLGAYPVLVRLARRHHVWDPLHDTGYALLTLAAGGAALHWHWAEVTAMAGALGTP
ncbi:MULTISPECIES: oligosaccharide flippase family protein [unclassified Leisingera]|uniref:oligosaccharide flippase family protein n=1 Tax=unclassified Leisingera TaxID=2614906 RepID=UPI0002E5D14B|nr:MULTISPECIES: oligosaccharide flippase family protein [unclassified Leisingera]KIC23335.1 polysaccharide biosynthesis protein [Leisingera sp. ANG-S3]KIC54838.1 polysaccharide biosynthesis protein [Leisingera sp. ANG-S]KID08535.1 polysaccharide biosynthesis protein [Leisingera sp. ANG1]